MQITLQVGTKANQSIKVGLTDMRAEALGLQSSSDVTTIQDLHAAVRRTRPSTSSTTAVQKALDQQTTIGAVQSRLSYTSSNLTTASARTSRAPSPRFAMRIWRKR
jgi:flagellin